MAFNLKRSISEEKSFFLTAIIGAILFFLSWFLLPEEIGMRMAKGNLEGMVSKHVGLSIPFLISLTAGYLYRQGPEMKRLLVLAFLGNLYGFLILAMNLLY